MDKWITIAPIVSEYQNRSLFEIDLGDVKFIPIPDKLKQMEGVQYLGFYRSESLKDAEVMLSVGYEATSLGDPDLDWLGEEKRSKQEIALEKIMLCNLALWLAKPSPLGFDFYMHINHLDAIPSLINSASVAVFRCNSKDSGNSLKSEDFEKAKQIYLIMKSIPRNSTLWISITSLIQALTSHFGNIRFMLLWIALESLFGAKHELQFRISQRIALFLGNNREEALKLFSDSKDSYSMRCDIIHTGSYAGKGNSEAIGYNAEEFIRKALVKIIDNNQFVEVFNNDEKRKKFLDGLAFKN